MQLVWPLASELGEALMNEDAWIERRLSDAVKAATTDAHTFPDAVIVQFRALLSTELQNPKRPSELDEIATLLIAANRQAT